VVVMWDGFCVGLEADVVAQAFVLLSVMTNSTQYRPWHPTSLKFLEFGPKIEMIFR
jgi:hypothetical protein